MNLRLFRVTGPLIVGVGLLITGIWSASNQVINAAEPERGSVEFERIDIPADQPAKWPAEVERLVEVPRQEFLALVEQINVRNRSPRLASLKSAHYEATLVSDTLQSGLMTASVQRLEGSSTLLELGMFSFALEDLKWQDRAAIWGSSADGRTWVLSNAGKDELLGEWSCRGRKIPGGIDFDLQLPQATISFLDLRVPRGFSVSAPSAEVTLLSDIAGEETRLWRIHCGSESRCRITFVAREGVEENRRVLIVEHDMQVVVRQEDLRFQLNLHLEALDAPVRELTLKVPAGLEIYSAVYGVDNPVPLKRTPEAEADGRWTIQLPGPLSGRRRTLRIDGIAVQKPGQPAILPQIVVENGTFDGGQLALTVQTPLQVRSIRANGYRQRTTDGERSFTFQQLTPDAQLILDVHRAQVSLSGQLLSVLSVEEDSWNLTSEIIWKSLAGGGYQTSCLFPPGWDVTDVRMSGESENRKLVGTPDESPRSREIRKLNWDVQPQAERGSILSIEFLEVISAGQSRSVKVFARRRLPQPGQPVPVPLPQIMNSDISDVILGMEIPNSMTSVVSADSRLERIARPASTAFDIPPEKPGFERRWYRGDSLDGTGTLEVTPRLQPVHVRTETLIEALPSEYRVKYSIHSENSETLADRLLVYLTESSPDVRWTWKGTQAIALSAVRFPKSQHPEWSLPANGELWEIRLPRAIGRDVTIEGTSASRWTVNNRPALIFVPQAVEKLAELKLTHPESLEVDLETDGLKLAGQHLSWSYSTPQAELGLALRNPLPSQEFPLMVSMQLRTLMSADTDGSDLYRARLQLENGSAQESLRIKLDPTAIVQEALVGGESIAATFQGGEFVIPGLNAARRDTVELSYRVPAQASVLCERRKIVVPQVSAQVLGFFWEFGIPPSARIFAEPSGVCLARSLPKPTLNERLFGPLGRTANETIFNPLRSDSWNQLLQSQRPPSTSIGDSGIELVALYHAVSPDVPIELYVELWQAERIQLLAWISLGISLLIGLLLRILGWCYRDRLAAYGLALLLGVTLLLSPPYSSFCGGAIAGILIALIVPRRWLQRAQSSEQLVGQGQRRLRGVLTALLVSGMTLFGLASRFEVSSFAQEPLTEDLTLNKRPRVYVPVDKEGTPSETVRLVYVPRDVLERWKTMAREYAAEPTYLISSARYQMNGTSNAHLNLLAKYRVHLLGHSGKPVTVALALSEVSLPDADSCQVNGVAYPVSILPNGKGYSIELTRRVDDELGTYEIELRSRRPRPQSASFELRIPTVANSQFTLAFPELVPFMEILGGRGASERMAKSRSLISELGSTGEIQIRWGQTAPPRKAARVSASLLQYLGLKPAYSEMHFHLVATMQEGSVDAMELDLPQNAIVRKDQLRADDLLRHDVIVTKDGQRRLRLVFEKPQQTSVTVDGTLVLLQSDSLVQTPLPKFGLSQSEWLKFQYERNWWGVSTSSDFRLETVNLDPENISTISSEAYLDAWVTGADSRRRESIIERQPQWTFELREGTIPAFTLIPYQTRRRATQWKQKGVIGRHRLEWTLTGEIETAHAPTFQTVLLVDRRLRIEEISVKENDAERLAGKTESRTDPSHVVLFLRDKTQGKQTITLRASLPLIPGTPITLPFVRPEECETTNSILILMRDPDVDVAFTPPSEWRPVAIDESTTANSPAGSPVLMGSFQLNDPVVRGTIQTSSRHSRCSSRSAVLLRRNENASWQLKYRLEMIPEGESPLRMGLTFPASFGDFDSVKVNRAEPAWHEFHEGLRQLDLLLNRNEGSKAVVVQFETMLIEPKLPDWELPLPIPLYSSSHESFVVIESDTVWFPTGGRELRVGDLPEWSSSFYSELPGGSVAFKVAGPSVEIQRDVAQSELREPSIRLLDQRMWLRPDGGRSGITQAFLSSLRSDLVFDLPAGVHVTSIFLDDHPVALILPVDGRLTIPLSDTGTEPLLKMTWDVRETTGGSQRLPTEPFLWPRDIKIDRNLVTILPDDPTAFWSSSGLTVMSSLDQDLDWLDALLDRHAALGAETRGAVANRWMIDQMQKRLRLRLPAEIQHRSEQVERQLQHWRTIVDRINQLERVSPASPNNWQAQLFEGPVADSQQAIRGQPRQGAQIQVKRFDWRQFQIVFSVLLALILMPILRGTIRIEWSGWLHRQVVMSWLLLALVWWLFLTPSVFGPCLLIVALIQAVSQFKSIKRIVASRPA